MKVLVIGGGTSNERVISLKSSKAVFEAATKTGHDAELYDWDGTEGWLNENAKRFEVVLPMLHGAGGEDGVIQKILEANCVPFLGSNSAVSELCFHKDRCLKKLELLGIDIPRGALVNFEEYQQSELLNMPHVLKPINGGSSLDTFIYPDPARKDMLVIGAAFEKYQTLLLEKYISGIEVTVPVLENKQLPVIEIVPPEGSTFDFENKYNGKTKELVPAQSIGDELQGRAQQLGKKIHNLVGCRHLSRIDMIVQDGCFYVLEINTMPGMTDQSLFPKAAAAVGMDFPALVDYFIKLVVK